MRIRQAPSTVSFALRTLVFAMFVAAKLPPSVAHAQSPSFNVVVNGTIAGVISQTACYVTPLHVAHVEWHARILEEGTNNYVEVKSGETADRFSDDYTFTVHVESGRYVDYMIVEPKSSCFTFDKAQITVPGQIYSSTTLPAAPISATPKIVSRTFRVLSNGTPVQGALIEASPALLPSPFGELRTDYEGKVTTQVCCGYAGTISATKACFAPSSKSIGPITDVGQTDFYLTAPTYAISGKVRKPDGQVLPGVSMSGFYEPTETGPLGGFSRDVNCGATLTITPSYSDATGAWKFSPRSRTYTAVGKPYPYQDFDAFPPDTWVDMASIDLAGVHSFHRSGDHVTLRWSTNYPNTSTTLYLTQDLPDETSWRVIYDIKNAQNLHATTPQNGWYSGQFPWIVPPAGWSPVYGQGGFGNVDTHRILAVSTRSGAGPTSDMCDDFFSVYWVGKGQGDDEPDPTEGVTATLSDDRSDAKSFVGLAMAGPNPTRESVSFNIGLDREDAVEINVFDIAGRPVRTLQKRATMAAGKHPLTWDGAGDDGRQVPPGIYLVSARTGSWKKTVKLIRTK